jgi:excisionase family DNA binding protein
MKKAMTLWGVYVSPSSKVPLAVIDAKNLAEAQLKSERLGFFPRFVNMIGHNEASNAIIIAPRIAAEYKLKVVQKQKSEQQKKADDIALKTYSPKEFAKTIGLNVETVRRGIRKGRIPAKRFGHTWRITHEDLMAIIAKGVRGATNVGNRTGLSH